MYRKKRNKSNKNFFLNNNTQSHAAHFDVTFYQETIYKYNILLW